MRPVGFEPTTPALGEQRSIHTELRAQILNIFVYCNFQYLNVNSRHPNSDMAPGR